MDATRKSDEKPDSSVKTETMKLLANSPNGNHIMERSRRTLTTDLNDKKTHAAKLSGLFKKLHDVMNSLYEVELAETQIEHKEPFTVSFITLKKAKQRLLELYYSAQAKICHVNKFKQLEFGTDSLYIALGEEEQEDCTRPGMKTEWERLRSKDCGYNLIDDASGNLFPRMCCKKHKKHGKKELGHFKEEFRSTEVLCLCSKTYCCYEVASIKFKFRSKSLKRRVKQQLGDGQLDKYRLVPGEKVIITSTQTEVSAQITTQLLRMKKW